MRKKVIEVEKIVKLIKHAQFHVQGGNYNPIGYKSDGLEFKRRTGETECELRARCVSSMDWPDSNTMHIFTPLQKQLA